MNLHNAKQNNKKYLLLTQKVFTFNTAQYL